MKTNILVLGATGMLGQAVYKYLSTRHKNIMGTSRNKSDNNFLYFEFSSSHDLEKILKGKNFAFVINCIGALKGKAEKELMLLNAILPKTILKFSKKYSYRIIHISTDAVFSNDKELVNEKSKPNPSDYYGLSKLRGEITAGINIRTSILGFDPIEHKGLFELLLKNKKKKISGFTNQKWSGSTTLQLAQFIEWLTSENNFEKMIKMTNVIHFAPLGPVTKYEIIKTFSNLLFENKVIKGEGVKQTRILETLYVEEIKFKRYTKTLEKAFKELIKFYKKYVKTYKKN